MTFLPVNLKRHLHRFYKKAEYKEHRLLYLFLEITRRCNLTCRHCGSDCTSLNQNGELTTSSWIKIIKDIAERFLPAPAIVLTGGEPLIHSDFAAIIEKLHALKIRWGIVSNGYNLDESVLEILIRNDIHSITISLDGMVKSHNWLRGKSDAFTRAVRAIAIVSKSSIPLKDVVTCVYPGNLRELDDMAQLLIDKGMLAWRLFRIFPAGRAAGNNQLLLSVAETRAMIDWLITKRIGLRKWGLDVNLSCEGWLPYDIDQKVRIQPFFCRSGVNVASILCDGTITGCSNNAGRFYQGNILKDDFTFVWQHRFQTLRNRDWIKATTCGNCRFLKECEGSSLHLWRDTPDKPEFCYIDCFKPLCF
jgi:radical SAM protein with 4Fe4S-binding SPASM domain